MRGRRRGYEAEADAMAARYPYLANAFDAPGMEGLLAIAAEPVHEILWDDVTDEIYRRKDCFRPEDFATVFEALKHVPNECTDLTNACYHVLSVADPSGRLLEQGMTVAFEHSKSSSEGLDDAGLFVGRLPKTPSSEFCAALRRALERHGFSILRIRLHGFARRCR